MSTLENSNARLRIGLSLAHIDPNTSPTAILETAIAAENAGFDAVFVPDHVLNIDRGFADPLIALAAIASITSQISLGTSVLVLPYRQPVVLANQLATIDRISSGRLIVAAGVGWNEDEYAATGAATQNRGRVTNETLQTLRNLLAGGTISNRRIGVDPTRVGGPPIWIGGHGEAALKRTATFGDAWHGFDATPEMVNETRNRLRELAPERNIELTTTVPPTSPAELPSVVLKLREAGTDFVVLQCTKDGELPSISGLSRE